MNDIKKIFISFLMIFAFFDASISHASQPEAPVQETSKNEELLSKSVREKSYFYGYRERDHELKENMRHIGGIYVASWIVYPLTQPKTFKKGSFSNYRKNFGKVVFDKDEPFWNWVVHPISGSQLYLYYRANGYNNINSLAMSFISSTLFEFTVENYTEPASIQDLYTTPVLGAVLGLGIEKLSMYLLNTGNFMGRFLGHAINPHTLFWYYEGRVRLLPYIDKKKAMLNVSVSF